MRRLALVLVLEGKNDRYAKSSAAFRLGPVDCYSSGTSDLG